jgi:hypothetical protein
MKIIPKIKKRSLFFGILFAMLMIGIVYAAESYRVNSGTQVTIDEWGVCKKVTNNNALAIFVPTKTAAEWTAFRTYATGVTYAECCSANGVACSSDANCCSAICGTDADADNYFSLAAGHTGTCQATSKPYTDCCDTDARVYPGQTTYYFSINACGSWDYDCSGTIDKSGCTMRKCGGSNYAWCYTQGGGAPDYCGGNQGYWPRSCTNPASYQGDCGTSGSYITCTSRSCYVEYPTACQSTGTYWCTGSSRTCACK